QNPPRRQKTGEKETVSCLVGIFCNWLAGSLSGPKSPISRHTSRFFLTIALLWPAKNRFVWRKMGPFLAQTRPANQLLYFYKNIAPFWIRLPEITALCHGA
ncbi:MAG: hypothetical protein ACR2K1_15235, partial [Saprospiraceae bacterium]